MEVLVERLLGKFWLWQLEYLLCKLWKFLYEYIFCITSKLVTHCGQLVNWPVYRCTVSPISVMSRCIVVYGYYPHFACVKLTIYWDNIPHLHPASLQWWLNAQLPCWKDYITAGKRSEMDGTNQCYLLPTCPTCQWHELPVFEQSSNNLYLYTSIKYKPHFWPLCFVTRGIRMWSSFLGIFGMVVSLNMLVVSYYAQLADIFFLKWYPLFI